MGDMARLGGRTPTRVSWAESGMSAARGRGALPAAASGDRAWRQEDGRARHDLARAAHQRNIPVCGRHGPRRENNRRIGITSFEQQGAANGLSRNRPAHVNSMIAHLECCRVQSAGATRGGLAAEPVKVGAANVSLPSGAVPPKGHADTARP